MRYCSIKIIKYIVRNNFYIIISTVFIVINKESPFILLLLLYKKNINYISIQYIYQFIDKKLDTLLDHRSRYFSILLDNFSIETVGQDQIVS